MMLCSERVGSETHLIVADKAVILLAFGAITLLAFAQYGNFASGKVNARWTKHSSGAVLGIQSITS